MIQSYLYKLLKAGSFSYELLLTKDSKQAQDACEVFSLFRISPFVLPELPIRYGDDLSSFREEFLHTLHTLRGFYAAKEPKILVSPITSVLYALPKADILQSFMLNVSQHYNFSSIKERIIEYGYECVEVVELEGEVSFRGDIIDIFIPQSKNPYRIAFFDDEIENIRCFDTRTQMSNPADNITQLEILPALFSLDTQENSALEHLVQGSDFEGFNKNVASFGLWFLGERAHFLPLQYATLLTPCALSEAREIYGLDSMQEAIALDKIESLSLCEEIEGYNDIAFNPKNLISLLKAHSNRKITLLTSNDIKLKAFDKADLQGVEIKHSNAIVNLITPNEFPYTTLFRSYI